MEKFDVHPLVASLAFGADNILARNLLPSRERLSRYESCFIADSSLVSKSDDLLDGGEPATFPPQSRSSPSRTEALTAE